MASLALKSYVKSVLFSYSSKMVVLASGLLYTLLVANSLGPEKYGLITFLITFVVGLLSLAGMRVFNDVLLVFTAKYKSRDFFLKMLGLQMTVALAFFVGLFLFADPIVSLLGKGSPQLLVVAGLFLFTQPLYETFLLALQSFKRFGKNLYGIALENFLELFLAAFLIGSLGMAMHGVVIAKALSTLAAIALFWLFIRKLGWEKNRIPFAELKVYLKGIIPENLLSSFRDQGLLWMMGLFLETRGLGLYFIAQKMLVYTLGSINTTLTDVLLPYNVEKHADPRTMCNYTSLNIKFLNLLSLLAGGVLILFSPLLLSVFFPQYAEAAGLVPLFVALYFSRNLALLSPVYKALNRTVFLALSSLFSLLVTIAVGLWLIPSLGLPGFLLTEIAGSLAKNVPLWLNLRRLGYPVEIVPRWKDLKYFWELGWKGVGKLREKIGLKWA